MNGSFGSGLREKYQAEAVLDQWYDPETEVLVCSPHKNALLKHGKKGTVNSLVRLQEGMAKRRSGRGYPGPTNLRPPCFFCIEGKCLQSIGADDRTVA
jgi:hypothetical protein